MEQPKDSTGAELKRGDVVLIKARLDEAQPMMGDIVNITVLDLGDAPQDVYHPSLAIKACLVRKVTE